MRGRGTIRACLAEAFGLACFAFAIWAALVLGAAFHPHPHTMPIQEVAADDR